MADITVESSGRRDLRREKKRGKGLVNMNGVGEMENEEMTYL